MIELPGVGEGSTPTAALAEALGLVLLLLLLLPQAAASTAMATSTTRASSTGAARALAYATLLRSHVCLLGVVAREGSRICVRWRGWSGSSPLLWASATASALGHDELDHGVAAGLQEGGAGGPHRLGRPAGAGLKAQTTLAAPIALIGPWRNSVEG